MKDIKAMQYIEFDVVKFENSSTLRFILIRCCTRPLRSTHFFISIILITTNERIYIKNLEFINFDIFASKEILRNLDTLSLYKIYIISLVIIINDEKKYIKIYIDWKVGMKNSVRGFEMFDWRNGTRVPPSDVPNFQKKVRALSCYTVVPLCRKQSIKEVSLY